MSIADELQRAGYTTFEASDCDEALATLKSSQVALVLTNVRMEGSLDGIDLAKWIVANRQGLSVIFISTNVTGDISSGSSARNSTFRPNRLTTRQCYASSETFSVRLDHSPSP